MTEQTSDAPASSQTSSSDSIIAAAKASQASSLVTSPGGAGSASQTGDIDPGSPSVDSKPRAEIAPGSTPTASDLSIIFARLQNIEAVILDHFGPKVEALEPLPIDLSRWGGSRHLPSEGLSHRRLDRSDSEDHVLLENLRDRREREYL